MTTKPLRHFLLACFALSFAALAQADIFAPITFDPSNQALLDSPPDTTDYEGVFYDEFTTFYTNPITIGTFDITIPTGYRITGATISGTFGDVNYPGTALVDLFVDGGTIDVGGCDDPTANCATNQGGPLATWSHTFTATELGDLASDFAGGSLDFTALQNSAGAIIIGDPTLDLQITPVPEPSSVLFSFGGLLALAARRRRT